MVQMGPLPAGGTGWVSTHPLVFKITSCRYDYYIYQLDLSTNVILAVFFGLLGFFVIRWEKLVKDNQWIIYTISLASVIIIEVRRTPNNIETSGSVFVLYSSDR